MGQSGPLGQSDLLGQLPPQGLSDLSGQLHRSGLLGQLLPESLQGLTLQSVPLIHLNDVYLSLPRLKEPPRKLYRSFR